LPKIWRFFDMTQEKKTEGNITRRSYLQTVGVAVAGLVVGGAIGYLAKPTVTAPPEVVTTTATETVTVTGTVAPPTTTAAPAGAVKPGATINIISSSPFDSVTRYHGAVWGPKMGVTINSISAPAAGTYDVAMTDFMGHSGSYDAIEYGYEWLADFVEGGYVVELDPYIDKYNDSDYWNDLVPTCKKFYTEINGHYYGIPFDGDSINYYYRKDIFERDDVKADFKSAFGYDLGPAGDWNQYLDIAKFFTQTTKGKYIKYGNTEATHRGRMAVWWFGHRLLGMGGIFLNPDGTPAVNTDIGVKALDHLKESLTYAPPGAIDYEFQEHENAMVFGQAAQMLQWANVWSDVELNPKSFVQGKKPTDPDWPLGIAPVPGVGPGKPGHTLLAGGWSYTINKDSKDPEDTYRFLIYMCRLPQSEWQNIHPETGVQPSLVSQYKDPVIIDVLGQAFMNAYSTGQANGVPDLRFPHAPEMLDYLDQQVSRAVAGQVGSKAALDDVASHWTDLCKKYFGSPNVPANYVAMQTP